MSPFFLDQQKFDGKKRTFCQAELKQANAANTSGAPGQCRICRLFRTEARQAKIDLPAEKPDTILLTIELVEKWWW